MSYRQMKKNKGQALVETSIILIILFSVLFFMISVGFYIYDLIVFTFATNKALDKGVALLSRNNTEIMDSISGNELVDTEIEEIKGILINSSNTKILVPNEPDVQITTVEDDEKVELIIDMKAKYECILPINVIFSDISVSLKYSHIKPNPNGGL